MKKIVLPLLLALVCFGGTTACKKPVQENRQDSRVLQINVDGQGFSYTEIEVDVEVHNGVLSLVWDREATVGTIVVSGASPGSYPWTATSTQFDFYDPPGFSPSVFFLNFCDDGLEVSEGSVTLSKIGAVGEGVEGSFILENAGRHLIRQNGQYTGFTRITGTFKLTRDE
jgi:hypothetical protein